VEGWDVSDDTPLTALDCDGQEAHTQCVLAKQSQPEKHNRFNATDLGAIRARRPWLTSAAARACKTNLERPIISMRVCTLAPAPVP
jgi:hypothetical protein